MFWIECGIAGSQWGTVENRVIEVGLFVRRFWPSISQWRNLDCEPDIRVLQLKKDGHPPGLKVSLDPAWRCARYRSAGLQFGVSLVWL